jgi:hypothetical protein
MNLSYLSRLLALIGLSVDFYNDEKLSGDTFFKKLGKNRQIVGE